MRLDSPTVFLLNSLVVGGTERKIVRLANALRRAGRPVHLVYLNPPETLLEEVDEALPTLCLDRHGWVSPAAMAKLRHYLRDTRAATLVALNLYPTLYSSAAALLAAGAPIRHLVGLNTTRHLTRKARMQMTVYAPLLRRADHLIFGCQNQLDHWTQQYRLHRPDRSVIYNGVDCEFFRPGVAEGEAAALRARLRLGPDDLVIGSVGQLRVEKAHADLIDALAVVREGMGHVKGLLVGSGPEMESLERRISRAGLSGHVTLLGATRDVRPALELMDIFVLPSVFETFSNAALEAMAMGKSVVLSDVGGAREMVDPGITGHLFPQGSVEALAGILVDLARSRSLRRMLGENARESAEQRFSFTRMVSDYDALLAAPAGTTAVASL